MATAKVEKMIAENAVVVFSKSWCPYCTKVKDLLKSLKAQVFAVELDKIPDGEALHAALKALSGQRTVPNVYIKGKHIGGNDDTHALHRKGGLVPLLK